MSKSETGNQSFYDADSSVYDALRWESAGGRHTNAVHQRILATLCGNWSGTALEVGPGTARFTMPLLRQGVEMTLVDISAGMLTTAQENIEAAGLAEHLEATQEGSIYELPFSDGTFDHSISLNVLNHLEDATKAISELGRVVKPGGEVLFNYANLCSLYWPAARRINARGTAVGQDVFSTWERPSVMKRAMREAGLDLVQRVGCTHAPRGMERFKLVPLVKVIDKVCRRGPFNSLAAVHFCLCRKR